MLSGEELKKLKDLGKNVQKVDEQIENFKKGFPFADLQKAATLGDGIIQLTDQEVADLSEQYSQVSSDLSCTKFVPASGAASRMFKDLFAFVENPELSNPIINTIKSLNQFAFADEIKDFLSAKGKAAEDTIESYVEVARHILENEGLNYGHLPKGLILFHSYDSQNRTAFEEHLVEAAEYACGNDKIAKLHFTVSPEHQSTIEDHINNAKERFEKQFNITYDISFSIQLPSTDTIAVNMDNTPFTLKDGSFLFRPGGHGALIENLNQLDTDIVFIKNIDNVVPDTLKKTTYDYKKALGSQLISIRKSVFETLEKLDQNEGLNHAINLAKSLGIEVSNNESSQSLYEKLNRPIRICGMVKNEGEPGGGPFWVKDSSGIVSLQIIESSQIDTNNSFQKMILENATHFNPVDLVCSISDYKGSQFDLTKFIDPETGFISYKSKDGKELKAQELPGLWNGAMAKWITLFVEVPMITFNPVKTLNDLLREEHQA